MESRFHYGMQLDLTRSENSEDDAKIYVVVGDDAKESESTLRWAIRNSGGRKLCILHIHHPPETIPILGRDHHISTLPSYKVKAYRDSEKQLMINALEDCIAFCQKSGVSAERLFAERESVEKGLLELVYQYKIEYLVIGAAANTSDCRNSIEPVSKMATYVQSHAPASCNIWLIYRGKFIYARESGLQANQHAAKERLLALQQPTSSNAIRNTASSSSQTTPSDRDYNGQMYATSNSQVEETTNNDSYGPLTRALVESKTFKQLTCGDSSWCRSFQLEAILRLNDSESLYLGELRRRKEKEAELEKLTEELHLAENVNAEYDQKIRDLEKNSMYNSDVHKGNRGKFIDPYAESSSSSSRKDIQTFMHELSFNEIIKATCDLDPLLLIREVGYESVYRGKLSETDVAIKILQPDEKQFQKEVSVLSKFRHPNMITLMGVCSEASALVYEYLPNGSLEDRLDCKDNTPSLSWQTRISIATELCSSLIFFHSREPHMLIHASLKPSCIYMDSNFSCKIGDFRSSYMILVGDSVRDNSIAVNSVYMDPDFVETRVVSPDMDVYAYGIVLLKLLTGRTALRLIEKVKTALIDHELEQVLDNSAGDWPFWQAKQLAHLGLSCCEHTSDLKLDVWPVLEQMRRMNNESVASNPSQPDDEPPFYFICPILQEPMKDPHVAADGFTYEAEALREWLNGGHDTSPMTNERLPHLNLVPNLALRSAIKEWQDQRREQ